MGIIRLPQDFRDFLKLLNCHEVEYLLIGGFAVGYLQILPKMRIRWSVC